jgi:heptosyltransferase-2
MEILNNIKDKILVIQTAFPGDAILSLPMIRKLKDMNRDSIIDVLCTPQTRDIFKLAPYINEIIVIDKKGEHRSLLNFIYFSRMLKKRSYARIYSPHRSFRTAFMILQSGIRETYGFSNSSFLHVYKYLIDYKIEHHEVQRGFDLIGYNYNADGWKILPKITIPPSVEQKIADYLKDNINDSAFAVIAPGSIWATKKYPLEHFKAIIKYLISLNLKVIIIGGKDEEETGNLLTIEFKESLVSAAGKFTFAESIALLKHAVILISNDSAPAHLGLCADIPVLTLYCSTVPEFGFYPYNGKSRWLSISDLDCKPCGIHGYNKCPLNHFLCGNKLEAGMVIPTIKEILNVPN